MRTENWWRRRVLHTCGPLAVVLAVGLLAVSITRTARSQDQSLPGPPSPPPYSAKGMTVRVSGNIMEKKIVHQVPPVYPPQIGNKRMTGSVVLRIVIAQDGSVEQVFPVSGAPVLLQAAIDAVKQWRYTPTTLNGQPIKVDTTAEVSFDAAASNPAEDASKLQTQTDPWTESETVTPADLEKELGDPDPAKRPTVACVAFKFLYDGGHVPGASFHGPGSTPEGLADLKAWAASLPKSSNVVLYCRCCPLVRCPNLRPAFTALHGAGFARLRVLLLPTNFATDWAAKGYPIEKGK